jgi:hypothetical protein
MCLIPSFSCSMLSLGGSVHVCTYVCVWFLCDVIFDRRREVMRGACVYLLWCCVFRKEKETFWKDEERKSSTVFMFKKRRRKYVVLWPMTRFCSINQTQPIFPLGLLAYLVFCISTILLVKSLCVLLHPLFDWILH